MEPPRPAVSSAGFWDGLYADGQDGWELGGPAPALEDWLASGRRFERHPQTSVRGSARGLPADGGSAGASSDRLSADGGSAGASPDRVSADGGSAGASPDRLSADGGSAGAISGPPHSIEQRIRASAPSGLPEGTDPRPRVAVPGAGRGHDARLLARHGYRVTAFDFAHAAVSEARRLAAADGLDVAVEQRDVFTVGRDYPGGFDGVWEYTCFCAIDPARREEYARVLHAILRPGGLLLACFYPLREGTDGPPFPVSRADVDRALGGRFRVLRAGPPGRSVERRRELEWLVEARRM